MDTSVALQADFYPLYILSALIFAAVLVFLILLRIFLPKLRRRKAPQNAPAPSGTQPAVPGTKDPKKVYLKKLTALEKDLSENKITARECYQQLSGLIRNFVNDVSGVDVTTKTLIEIQAMRMPGLQTLIEEYYEGEFGPDGEARGTDPMDAIENTKKVIKAWN